MRRPFVRFRVLLVSLVSLFSFALLACGGGGREQNTPIQRELTPAEQQVAFAVNTFGFDLFREVLAVEEGENLFISPLSVSYALGMTYNGAAADTEAAMRQALGYGTLTLDEVNEAYAGLTDLLVNLDPLVQLEIANSIWHREELAVDPGFVDRNEEFFDAIVQGLDFGSSSAAPTINQWVSDSTHGLIPQIVEDPISSELVMFLINAVYFKGTWTTQFDPEHTWDEGFTTIQGATVTVPMMHLHADLLVQETAEVQAVDLGYSSGSFRMAVILPKPGVDVDAVAAGLDSSSWAAFVAGFAAQESDLALPRLELRYRTSLVPALSALGMEIAFTDAADFSGIAPGGLFISDVKHETFLRVDEEGTEAAAVTSVEIGITSVPQFFTMIVNRPYLIVIHDAHSQSLLFMGRIGNPVAE